MTESKKKTLACLLGGILLLLKKGLAEKLFLVSFIIVLITTLYNYGVSDAMEFMGDAFSLALPYLT